MKDLAKELAGIIAFPVLFIILGLFVVVLVVKETIK